MTDLIERLEKATGPDRGIDASIWWRFDRKAAERVYWNAAMGKPCPLGDEPPTSGLGWLAVRGKAPAYTGSFDAAFTLAGERVFAVLLEALAMAAAYFVQFSDKGGHILRHLPRFVCIAALKARLP